MKIAHILAQKPAATGSGIYITETIRAFAAEGAEQALIAGIGPHEEYSFPDGLAFYPVIFESEALPFPVVGMSDQMPYRATRYCDMTPQMVSQFRAAFDKALDSMLANFQPDLVICHHLYLLTAHVACREWPCPVQGVCHNTDLRQFQRIDLEHDAIKRGINRLDRVLALTSAQAETIVELFDVDPEKITIIGTGYNDQVFFRDTSCVKRAHSLLYVGKTWRQKGVPNLMRAFDEVSREYPDAHLDLVGGYSNKDEYDSIIAEAAQCAGDYRFCGVVSQADLVDAYNRAEVFVLPSFSEGLPLVVLEALACGCKVVLSDLPGLKDWLDSSAPDAPVLYVKPPRPGADSLADEGDFERFERDLAQAIRTAFELQVSGWSVRHLSWRAVCNIMKSNCDY